MANLMGLIAIGVGVLALVCGVVACALPYWITVDSMNAYAGLWKFCYDPLSMGETCQDPGEDMEDEELAKLNATKAMVILGIVCSLGGVIPLVLLLFVMKEMKLLGFIGGGVFIAAGLFYMIGMAIYVDSMSDEDMEFDYGAGLALDILGWITAWIAGALAFLAAIKGDSSISA